MKLRVQSVNQAVAREIRPYKPKRFEELDKDEPPTEWEYDVALNDAESVLRYATNGKMDKMEFPL